MPSEESTPEHATGRSEGSRIGTLSEANRPRALIRTRARDRTRMMATGQERDFRMAAPTPCDRDEEPSEHGC